MLYIHKFENDQKLKIMKKNTLFILLISTVGYSQNAPISFETGQFGSTCTLASFENGSGAGYSKVSNPFPGGINSFAQ